MSGTKPSFVFLDEGPVEMMPVSELSKLLEQFRNVKSIREQKRMLDDIAAASAKGFWDAMQDARGKPTVTNVTVTTITVTRSDIPMITWEWLALACGLPASTAQIEILSNSDVYRKLLELLSEEEKKRLKL